MTLSSVTPSRRLGLNFRETFLAYDPLGISLLIAQTLHYLDKRAPATIGKGAAVARMGLEYGNPYEVGMTGLIGFSTQSAAHDAL